MEQLQMPFKKRDLVIVCTFLASMMVIGSFFDLQISQLLYNEQNPFGIFFAAFGEYPATLGFVATATMLFVGRNRDNKLIAVLQLVSAALLLFMGTSMICILPGHYLSWPKAVIAIMGVLSCVLVVLLFVRLTRNTDRKVIIRVALAFFLVAFGAMLIINFIKVPWERPRMRMLAHNELAAFAPWWQIGGDLRETLMLAGVSGEEFKSFPSGHTANAATLMLLALLPYLDSSLWGKRSVLFLTGAGWAATVALSRVFMGAHFVTDTMVGFAVTLLIILVATKLCLGKVSANTTKSQEQR